MIAPALGFGMAFADLYRREGLVRLDQAFIDFLGEGDPALRARLEHARLHPDSLDRKEEAALLIEVGPWLEDFIAKLFGIEKEAGALAARHHQLAPLYSCKRLFVQRRAMNKVSAADAAAADKPAASPSAAAGAPTAATGDKPPASDPAPPVKAPAPWPMPRA